MLLVLCACGGSVNWGGVYSGSVSTTGTCSDGSQVNTTTSATATVAETGNDIVAATGDGCSPYLATANGNVAHVSGKTCSDGSIITGGLLTLNGGALTFEISEQATSGGVTCAGQVSGTLQK